MCCHHWHRPISDWSSTNRHCFIFVPVLIVRSCFLSRSRIPYSPVYFSFSPELNLPSLTAVQHPRINFRFANQLKIQFSIHKPYNVTMYMYINSHRLSHSHSSHIYVYTVCMCDSFSWAYV